MGLFHSTRSREATCTAKQAIRRGIAPDGGLYVSDALGETTIGGRRDFYKKTTRRIYVLNVPRHK